MEGNIVWNQLLKRNKDLAGDKIALRNYILATK